ncbi:MAG TPA: hypothetical protein VFL59_12975 [Candidatus Nanopelagicales bacterium]|nr:hypothetical protein [Candidatus Nanopelagicales bacterium]
MSDQLQRTSEIIASASGPADLRRRLGAWAIEAADAAGPEAQDRWRAIVASRLPSQDWPDQRVLLTVVDADTGEPGVLDRASGASLADAVAASCSSGSAYRIGDRRFIDGGYRANADNPDVATGYSRILVLSPFGGSSRWPVAWAQDLEAQVARLRAEGSRVELVLSDAAVLGENAMDYSARPSAARGGHAQGLDATDRVRALWSVDA